MQAYWEAPVTEESLRGATLVLPVVAVGNAGEGWQRRQGPAGSAAQQCPEEHLKPPVASPII